MTLYDDGAHGDGAAGGAYGGMFYRTQSFGGYNLVAEEQPHRQRRYALHSYVQGFNMLQFRLLNLGIEGVDPNRVYRNRTT